MQIDHRDSQSALGNGDSGGPVYKPVGSSFAAAKGTMTAQDDRFRRVPCAHPPGLPTGPARNCSSRGWYVDITNTLALYGATIP